MRIARLKIRVLKGPGLACPQAVRQPLGAARQNSHSRRTLYLATTALHRDLMSGLHGSESEFPPARPALHDYTPDGPDCLPG